MRGNTGAKGLLFLTAFLCTCLLGFATLRRHGASKDGFVDSLGFLYSAFLPKKKLTIQEGKNWYFENKEALMDLHRVVRQNPSIWRVDPGMRIEFVPNSENFTPETIVVYDELEKTCVALGIKNIAIFKSHHKGDLLSIRYTLGSRGLSISGGRALGIVFNPDKLSLSRIYNTPEYIITPLDEENWYIVDYREGRK